MILIKPYLLNKYFHTFTGRIMFASAILWLIKYSSTPSLAYLYPQQGREIWNSLCARRCGQKKAEPPS